MAGAPDSRSMPDLISDAFAQFAVLIRNEVDLARAELSRTASKATNAIVFVAAGAVLMIPALVLVLFAIAEGLMHLGLSDALAYLVAGGGAALIALGLIWVGVDRLTSRGLKPDATLHQLRRDKAVAKELIR